MMDLTALTELADGMSVGEKSFWVACTVGIAASLTRMTNQSRTDWWVWCLLIHGFIFFYATKQCDEGSMLELQLPQPIHDSFCCKDCKIEGYSQTERVIMMIGAILGIVGNVIPKYWKGDEAVRHIVHMKKRKIANPLLFHIISGICTVLIGGVLSLSSPYVQNDKLMLALLWVSDVAHQISIHRLLKNHDGIWTLRCGNMQLAVMKWIVLLRVSDRQDMIDLIFFQSCGFLGTRVFVTLVYILMYFGVPTAIFEEDWYSIGLTWAQFWIYARMWDVAAPIVWISIVACSALYFHQLWREYLHLRNIFVLANCAAMGVALSLPKHASFAFTLVYWCIYFMLPGFKRQPLTGHLKGTLKTYKTTKSEKQAKRLEKKLDTGRKLIVEGKVGKKKMQGMIKFLQVTEYRKSLRASAMMLAGLSSRTIDSIRSSASSLAMPSQNVVAPAPMPNYAVRKNLVAPMSTSSLPVCSMTSILTSASDLFATGVDLGTTMMN